MICVTYLRLVWSERNVNLLDALDSLGRHRIANLFKALLGTHCSRKSAKVKEASQERKRERERKKEREIMSVAA
jgi:hypothetical protein